MTILYLTRPETPALDEALAGHDVTKREWTTEGNTLPEQDRSVAADSDLSVIVFPTPNGPDDFFRVRDELQADDMGEAILIGVHPDLPTHCIEGAGIRFRYFGQICEGEEILLSALTGEVPGAPE